MKRWLRLVATTVSLCLALSGTMAAQKEGRAHGSSGARVSSSSRPVHVKAYTKKDGTEVAAHDRKAPASVQPSLGALTKTTAERRGVTAQSPLATANALGSVQTSRTSSTGPGRPTAVPREKAARTTPVLTNLNPPRAYTGSVHIVTDAVTGRKTITNAPASQASTPLIPPTLSRPKAPARPTTVSGSVARDERGRIQRSDAARHAFARQTGYPNGRPGYVIDHIKPLACGGLDAPSNMQWQTIAAGKAKDKVERIGCK